MASPGELAAADGEITSIKAFVRDYGKKVLALRALGHDNTYIMAAAGTSLREGIREENMPFYLAVAISMVAELEFSEDLNNG